jgi:small conductance mechanosensitive channel
MEASPDKQAAEIALMQQIVPRIAEFIVKYFFQIAGAALLLAAGWWLGGRLGALATRFCESRKIDVLLARFIGSTVKFAFMAFVVLTALGMLSIPISPLVAVIGAGTLGISLALQGPISNYGAGLIIILTRPFTLGDTLSVQGVSGVVQEVKMGFTRLLTEDSEVITIPNKQIVGEIQTNSKDLRIAEAEVGVAYGCDVDAAIAAVRGAVGSVHDVQSSPGPQVGIDRFGDSAIVIGYRYWLPSRSFHPVRYAVNRAVYDSLQKTGVAIPFPQRVVHVRNDQIPMTNGGG